MEEGLDCSASVADLLCTEDGACLDGPEEDGGGVDGVAFVGDSALSESEDEYIGLLVSRESSGFEGSCGGGGGCFSSSGSGEPSAAAAGGDWLKSARSGAVRWILKVGACRIGWVCSFFSAFAPFFQFTY